MLFEVRGQAGVITLNRPKALNALTHEMAIAIAEQLRAWAGAQDVKHVIIKAVEGRAFCAGGDIRALYDWGREDQPRALQFYRDEYTLNALIKRYPKPFTALIDGFVMGGGVGISLHGRYRIATENILFAMPETGIGLFPDVGGTYFLPRMPGEIGLYLGLTGHRLKRDDALFTGVATHTVAHDQLAVMFEQLCAAPDPEDVLSLLTRKPEKPALAAAKEEIDSHFESQSLDGVMQSLSSSSSDFAEKTRETLATKSPTSLAVTFQQLRRGRDLNFEDCMELEFSIVSEVLKQRDFFEGIRAIIIDKDNAPNWTPNALEAVTDDMVARYFEPTNMPLALPKAA
ncbi:MAG: enoyl-CoA hydratase/isomerase family protein [Pseudomonadota bacterium]